MNIVWQIDSLLANNLPLYAGVSKYAQDKCKGPIESLGKIYNTSQTKVLKVTKNNKGFKNQVIALCSQSADDLLDLVEDRLTMKITQGSDKDKSKRVVKILVHLKDQLILNPLQKAAEFNGCLIEKGKVWNEQYILPMFITLKATIVVSRQIMLEVLAQRLGQLKMTYKVSKDSVTMFFAGDFQEEKILARFGENINSFKQLTVQFVQKGMEIKISKRELFENYNTVVEKLTRVVQGVSSKSMEQWNDTKTKTINLYQKILNRIKEKEIEIKTEYVKQIKGQQTQETLQKKQESEPKIEQKTAVNTTQVQLLDVKQ